MQQRARNTQKSTICRLGAALWLALLCVPAQAADTGPRWTATVEQNSARLLYGPSGATPELELQCRQGTSQLAVRFHFDSTKIAAGENVGVYLRAGKLELPADAAVRKNPGGTGWRTELKYPLDEATQNVLRASTPITVKVVPDILSKPLARTGQDQAVKQFLTACNGFTQATTRTAPDGVPASYDCQKATRPVDQFICGYGALRWQDLALSRSYKAALAASEPGMRQVLQDSQRRWIKARDRQCIGQRSLKELQGEAANASYRCLLESYEKQRAGLVGFGPNYWARGSVETRLDDIARARPDWQATKDHTVASAAFSPDARLLALLLPSDDVADGAGTNQVWLYRIGTNKGVAVTPKPSGRAPGADDEVMRIETLAWQDQTLYVRTSLWGGSGEQHTRATYAATPEDRAGKMIMETPAIKALLDKAAQEQSSHIDLFPADERDAIMINAAWSNAKHLVWVADRGHGTIELMTQERKPGAKPYLINWGSWEQTHAVFDARNGRLLYPDETGLRLIDLNTRKTWDIIVPGPLARPLAMVAETEKIEGTSISWIEPILPGDHAPKLDAKKDQFFRVKSALLLPEPKDDE